MIRQVESESSTKTTGEVSRTWSSQRTFRNENYASPHQEAKNAVTIPPVPDDLSSVCRDDMEKRGWKTLDFIFVSGDAYVDHPSFAPAVISRVLHAQGYRVGVLPQPDWRGKEDFLSMGRPDLAVLVTAGNLDSMLSKFTASKKWRSTDNYSPGGQSGRRPDRATIAYCSRIRECWPDIPILIGGIEASLRRFAHYDYWSDEVRRSILVDSQADLLVYGMGERQIIEIPIAFGQVCRSRRYSQSRGLCTASPPLPECRKKLWESLPSRRCVPIKAFSQRLTEN